jgi:hypothetical protein
MDYLGPSGSSAGPLSQGEAIAVDRAGNVFVTGWLRDDIGLPFRCIVIRRLNPTPPPVPVSMQSTRSGHTVTVSWPLASTGFQLEASDYLLPFPNWSSETSAPASVGDQNVVTVEVGASSTKFFRLIIP